MKLNLKSMISHALCAALLMAAMLPAAVHAETPEERYAAANTYVLYYGQTSSLGDGSGARIHHASPYMTELRYKVAGDEPYREWTSTVCMYNQLEPKEELFVYCVDQYTSVKNDVYYHRTNIEDSSYFDDATAAKLRAITLSGFPHTDLKTLGAAVGIDDLWQGEAVHATQLAIWMTAYGKDLDVLQIVHNNDKDYYDKNGNKLAPSYPAPTVKVPYHLPKMLEEEITEYAVNHTPEEIEARVSKVIDYLLAQKPVAPTKPVVSQTSFVDWCDAPTLSLNTDGTYDVEVAATVDVAVDPAKNDNLTLTAVIDGHPQYFAAKPLTNGEQTVELEIEGIPADLANDPITLNIDGEQFAEDVFMFITEGGREAAQPMIGYHSRSLPVHASVTVEPERVINFYKTDRVITITEGNQETYVDVPLEGIQFDLYFAASYADFVSGKVQLPEQDKINLKDFTTAGLHYPKYSVVTDENGKASISLSKLGFVDGVYIVAERPHPAIEAPVKPFYVILPTTSSDGKDFIYQVQVAPKNDVKGDVRIEKDVIKLKNDEASWDASVPHTWIISASVPLDLAEGKSYVISDTLDTRLDYIGNIRVALEYDAEQAEGEEPILPLPLIENTDYTLATTPRDETDGDPAQTSFTVSLTKAGMTKAANAAGALYDQYRIRVYYDAAINESAAMGEKIPNQATLIYTNSVNFDFERESDIPVIYTCGISVLKHDSSDESKALSGAVFRLAKKVDAGTEGAELLAVADQGTIPVQYVSFYTTANMTGERADRVTTGADGRAILYGLAAGTDYYLVEVSAPLGYNKLSLAIPVTLDQISHLTVPTEGAQAVEGPNVKVENRKGSILPDTGGIGVIPLYALGSVLCIGTGIVLCRRRKGEED